MLKSKEHRFTQVYIHTVYLPLCVSLRYAISTPNHRPSESSTAFNSYKASRQAFAFHFCLFSPALSVAASFCVSKWIPPWWQGMWCESSDRGTLISEIHPGGLCPASSLSVQTLNFPTKTTRITAQPFGLFLISLHLPPFNALALSITPHPARITSLFLKTQMR